MSFVIPALNEVSRLPVLLRQLRRDFADCELIVVDGGSSDGSVAAAMGLADCILLGEPGRALQMNLGAACAKGDWLAFLHADTQPDFDEATLRAALDDQLRWGFCHISLQGHSRGLPMVSAFMNQRSRLTNVATGDQLLFVQRELFREVEGFRRIPLMEDVDICKRLRSRGAGGLLNLQVLSSGRRWDERGLWATIMRMWVLRLAYWLGVSPRRLWAHYYGKHAVPGSGGS
ncbi:TIGR04283 family arsenosugar biosynthesis glycosyltransferase [Congregibacter variabilis]|uniref:TIGR04283 family arsenosugar biosynthesis glycosyltransferase n=1 Tax=Congregibacter variabilis TaxID=3081200 RepID=A0ABZ0I6Y7_9GAMM|nr:TIGR04283 family arsenosugar biosynthesis glycosyltransferase [Congregibacter sp. IMCC43200]